VTNPAFGVLKWSRQLILSCQVFYSWLLLALGLLGLSRPKRANQPSTCPESLASIYFGRSSAWIRCLSPDRDIWSWYVGFLTPTVNRSRPTRCTSMGTRGFNFNPGGVVAHHIAANCGHYRRISIWSLTRRCCTKPTDGNIETVLSAVVWRPSFAAFVVLALCGMAVPHPVELFGPTCYQWDDGVPA